MAFFLKGADLFLLLRGKHVGDGFLNTQLLLDGGGCQPVVAGEHDHMDAHFPEGFDGGRAGGADGVRHRDDAGDPGACGTGRVIRVFRTGEKKGRFALAGEAVHFRLDPGIFRHLGNCKNLFHICRISCMPDTAVHLGADAAAGDGGKILRGRNPQTFRSGFFHNSLRQRVLASGFRRGGQGEKLPFGKAVVQHDHIRHGRMAGGDGSRFIQHDGVDGVQVFQAFGGFDEDAVFRRLSRSHHDGHGRGKAQRAGAGDDENGNGAGKGEFKARSGDEPDDGGQDGDGDDRGHEHAADLIRKSCDGRFGVARLVHQPDDLRQGGVVAHAGGAEAEGAVFIDGGGDDRIPFALFHGNAFSGDGGLIQKTVSFRDHAVHRNAHAGADDHDIPGHHLLGGDGDLLAVLYDHGGLGSQIHQLAKRVGGFGFGTGLQIFSHRY